ncbi:hypothetical protein ABZ700_15115 [Streptomyces diastaticus]|uniref:hypothetical protein n=1 Tax=Streptomyces TaxID=1883 RepID=UPI0033E85634
MVLDAEAKELQTRVAVVLGLLRNTATGEVLSYEQMGAVLGLDPDRWRERKAVQAAFRQARKTHLRTGNRWAEAVDDLGYRVIRPEETLRVAEQFEDRGLRSVEQAWDIVTYASRAGLSNTEKARLEAKRVALSGKVEAARRHAVKQRQRAETDERIRAGRTLEAEGRRSTRRGRRRASRDTEPAPTGP